MLYEMVSSEGSCIIECDVDFKYYVTGIVGIMPIFIVEVSQCVGQLLSSNNRIKSAQYKVR